MLAGVGQGSSNGPSGWHSVCEIIMAAYRELNSGCTWASPDKTLQTLVWLAGFVDDVVAFLGFLNHHTWEEALELTQRSYRSWQGLLESTGGSLSLAKSSYTLVYWIVDPRTNDYRMATKAESPGDVTMQAEGQTVHIARNEPHEASKDPGTKLIMMASQS